MPRSQGSTTLSIGEPSPDFDLPVAVTPAHAGAQSSVSSPRGFPSGRACWLATITLRPRAERSGCELYVPA